MSEWVAPCAWAAVFVVVWFALFVLRRRRAVETSRDLAGAEGTIEEGRTNKQLREDLRKEREVHEVYRREMEARAARAESLLGVERLKLVASRVKEMPRIVAVETPALIETEFQIGIGNRISVSPSTAGPSGMDLLLTGISVRPPFDPPHRTDSAWWEPLRTRGRFSLRVSRSEVITNSFGSVVRPWRERNSNWAEPVMRLDPPLRLEPTEYIEAVVDTTDAFWHAPPASPGEIQDGLFGRQAVLVLHGKWTPREVER